MHFFKVLRGLESFKSKDRYKHYMNTQLSKSPRGYESPYYQLDHAFLEQCLLLPPNESRESGRGEKREREEHDSDTSADISIEHFLKFVAAFKGGEGCERKKAQKEGRNTDRQKDRKTDRQRRRKKKKKKLTMAFSCVLREEAAAEEQKQKQKIERKEGR